LQSMTGKLVCWRSKMQSTIIRSLTYKKLALKGSKLSWCLNSLNNRYKLVMHVHYRLFDKEDSYGDYSEARDLRWLNRISIFNNKIKTDNKIMTVFKYYKTLHNFDWNSVL
jgi:hypothetical protein